MIGNSNELAQSNDARLSISHSTGSATQSATSQVQMKNAAESNPSVFSSSQPPRNLHFR